MTAAGHQQHEAGVFTLPPWQAALFDGGMLPFNPIVLFTFVARCRETAGSRRECPTSGTSRGSAG